MGNKKRKALALLAVLCCSISGCASNQVSAAEVVEEPKTVTGTVECKEVYVRAKIPGYLMEIPVVEGQEVAEDELLFSSDKRDIQVKHTQASGTLAAAQAVAEKAQANVDLLEEEYGKYQELFEMEAVAQDTMDKLTTQLAAAKLDVQAATAQCEAAGGVLAEVNLNLSQTAQYAPCNGTVTMVSSSVGELVGSGTTIITLTDYSDRWIYANVDEYQVGKLEIGQSVPLTSKAHPDMVFQGTIVNVSKNPDFAIKKSTNELNDEDVVTYKVKISLSAEEDILLYPGMLVSVDFEGNEKIDEAGEAA